MQAEDARIWRAKAGPTARWVTLDGEETAVAARTAGWEVAEYVPAANGCVCGLDHEVTSETVKFKFRVTGTEYRLSGNIVHPYEEEGEVQGDHVAEALLKLVHHELEWSLLDTAEPMTIEIEPAEVADGG